MLFGSSQWSSRPSGRTRPTRAAAHGRRHPRVGAKVPRSDWTLLLRSTSIGLALAGWAPLNVPTDGASHALGMITNQEDA